MTFSDYEQIKFYKNSLILIEVKNNFPSYNKEDKKEENDQEIEGEKEQKKENIGDLNINALKNELNILLRKAEVF